MFSVTKLFHREKIYPEYSSEKLLVLCVLRVQFKITGFTAVAELRQKKRKENTNVPFHECIQRKS
jgi:hypothetical protein